jgi:UDP-N-acetylglucosamine transferase subunit ALG13
MEWVRFIKPEEFRDLVCKAHALVGHAGVGTIFSALEARKPLLVLPRRAKYREHTSDHQVGTARRFAEAGHVIAAFDEQEMMSKLDAVDELHCVPQEYESDGSRLLHAIRSFVAKDRTRVDHVPGNRQAPSNHA